MKVTLAESAGFCFGVKKAVEEGIISRERYENYLKILSEIKTNYRY